MDWRAKSQSRSRSRLPDAMMDWRAQSRSRSRAPVPLPPLASYDSVTAQLNHLPAVLSAASTSRFYGDHGGLSPEEAREDDSHFDLAYLGLSPGGEYSTPYADDFDYSLLASKSTTVVPKAEEENTTNLSSIENTLNQLIGLQPPSSTSGTLSPLPWTVVDSGISNGTEQQTAPYSYKLNKAAPAEGYSLAQQQLQQLVNQVSAPSLFDK